MVFHSLKLFKINDSCILKNFSMLFWSVRQSLAFSASGFVAPCVRHTRN